MSIKKHRGIVKKLYPAAGPVHTRKGTGAGCYFMKGVDQYGIDQRYQGLQRH